MQRRECFSFYLNQMGAMITALVCTLFILLAASIQHVVAQQPAQSTPPSEIPAESVSVKTSSSTSGDRYRIGPGDVLDVRVFNRPQLSRDAVRVDGRGMIRMPLIEDEIRAACLTESELGNEIATRYLKYLLHPQVDVFIKEYQAQPVAVIGAVNAPGRFQLQRRVRLLELLAYAGGPVERAGAIQIVHSGTSSLCENPGSNNSEEEMSNGLALFKVKDTLRGDSQANPYILPGDIITLPEADQIYVVGNVVRPSAIPLKEPVTVSRAIAMAGGVLRDSKTDRVRIVRQGPGNTSKTEIYVNLKAIEKRNAEDVMLEANDIVSVPESAGKSFLRTLVGAVVPSVTQLPVRVIP